MARNAEKVYLTVGIPRRSPLYTRLMADAERAGVPLSQLIIVRMLDWYALSPSIQTTEESERRSVPHVSFQAADQQDGREISQQVRKNAAQALSSWV